MQIAVCDDNPTIRTQIVALLKECAASKDLDIELKEYQDGSQIVEEIKMGTRFHLIYMDIEMEQMDGLEAAEHIREYDAVVPLIFVTNYDTYAVRGYDVMSMAYLLKPIDREKFIHVFERAWRLIGKNEELFVFETLRSHIKLPIKEILYFQSNNKKVEIHFKNGREEFTAKLDDVEVQLEKSGFEFLRIHKSYLVNFKHIMRINGDRVILTDGKTLRISERYCTRVKARYLHFVEMRK